MAAGGITRKHSTLSLGSTTPKNAEPPSPALSAVHASGVSAPVPKLTLSSSTTASLSSKKNGPETAAADGKKPAKSQMKATAEDEEGLAQSRWFVRSWARKSAPVTKVAPETIERESPPPTPPEPETTTIAPVVFPSSQNSGVPEPHSNTPTAGLVSSSQISNASTAIAQTNSTTSVSEQIGAKVAEDSNDIDKQGSQEQAPGTSSWLGWWWSSGNQQQATTTLASEPSPPKESEEIRVSSDSTPMAPLGLTSSDETSDRNESLVTKTVESVVPEVDTTASAQAPPPTRTSWFGFWGEQRVAPAATPVQGTTHSEAEAQGDGIKPANVNEAPAEQVASTAAASTSSIQGDPSSEATATEVTKPENPPATASYGWGFWYLGGRTTSSPNPATIAENPETAPKSTTTLPKPAKVPDNVISVTPSSSQSQTAHTISTSSTVVTDMNKDAAAKDKSLTTVQQIQPRVPPRTPATASPATSNLQRICPQNHVFPSFDSCYDLIETPSILSTLTKLFKAPLQPLEKHLYRKKTPHQVKKAVAIGVHGFFPMRIVRTVLGEPTGTSVRFAEAAAAAIKRWAERNGVEIAVEKVALEGEGKVADRVEMLWKLLENWMDHVRNADFVLIAAHSQGVVVGLQLLARMIEQGCVDNARVGFAAMAGINLGPFYHLPTSILTGSAKELFEFQRQESAVSKKYIQALRVVLAHEVRIVFIGSIDDQLVPLESSTFSNIDHPYIYRAVFVDGRVHAPNFLSHLVGFAMKLRNLGISDHGLIRELSTPLAGSLYGGEGHSRIYDDGAVYDLAVRHALETTDCPDVPLRVGPFELPTNNNPFFLPWSMRGLLEEPFVREKLEYEKQQLLQQFEDWKPTSKVLKDVKFRLEGIRSKL